MKTRIQLTHWWDRRPLTLRRQDDRTIERIWRDRVARNPKEIARLRRVP